MSVVPLLVMSVMLLAEPKPIRVLVLGDDPMMTGDTATGAVGYASLLPPLFNETVTVDVQTSAALQPDDPATFLSAANKGDIVLLCKLPVEVEVEDKVMSDVYLDQLVAIQQAAKKKGVKTVWLTPCCPRYFTFDSVQVHRQGIFPGVVRNMCKRDVLPIVDVEQLLFDWITEQGLDNSAAAFVPVEPASEKAATKAAREGYQLTESGAQQVATMIGEAIRADKKNILNKRLR